MSLQAVGSDGYVDLQWTQDDFTGINGFNVYRSATVAGTYTKLNGSILGPAVRTYRDSGVTTGQTYYYKFTVIKGDATESGFSNIAVGTALDTAPPAITHMPIATAPPGTSLIVSATITDGVGVTSATLFYRKTGTTTYTSVTMTNAGSTYSASVPGAAISSPGLEYYLTASDAVSTASFGRAEFPWSVSVVDRPVVSSLSPTLGSASGGTTVVLTGSNFKAGALVRFGDVAASSISVNSASQITCITPASFPSVADVTVVNTDGQSGTLLRGFTFGGASTVSLGLPSLTGSKGAVVSVPVNCTNVSGLASASLVISFDGTVLRALGARNGTLTPAPGWTLAVNTNTLGRISFSMAGANGLTAGTGTLAILDFEVVGNPSTSTAVNFFSASLNAGSISLQTTAGSFAVNSVYAVAGTVRFWTNSAPVPGVTAVLSGSQSFTNITTVGGAYSVGGGEAGSYTLNLSKGDDATATLAITAYDASLVLQHDVGLITLTGSAATAADVDKSGTINALDAYYVLRKASGLQSLPFPGAGKVWDFTPASRSYPNLNANQSGQDFTAILIGDVSGNWVASGSPVAQGFTPKATAKTAAATPATVAVRKQTLPHSGKTRLWLLVKTAGNPVVSVDLSLSYPLATNIFANVRTGGGLVGYALSANTNQGGLLRAAIAGATPMSGISGVLVADVDAPAADIQLANLKLNEGSVPYVLSADGAVFDQDSDGDKVPDWIELLAGTDPGLQASLLRIKQVRLDAQHRAVVDTDTIVGKRYQLWQRDSLRTGTWQKVGAEFVATGAASQQVVDTLSANATQGYFLLEVVE